MPLLHLLGVARLTSECLVTRYHGQVVDRDVEYAEERGCRCICSDYKLHQPLLHTSQTSSVHRPVARRRPYSQALMTTAADKRLATRETTSAT